MYMYKVFNFLKDHLHCFLHFFFTSLEQLVLFDFLDDPISLKLLAILLCYDSSFGPQNSLPSDEQDLRELQKM